MRRFLTIERGSRKRKRIERRQGPCDSERGSCPGCGGNEHQASIVGYRHALREREAEPRSSRTARDKWLKKTRGHRGRDARTIIGDLDHGAAICDPSARLDPWRARRGSALRVVIERVQTPRKETNVGKYRKVRRVEAVEVSGGRFGQILARCAQEVGDEHGLLGTALASRERHQVIDDLVSQPRATLDLSEVSLTFGDVLSRDERIRANHLQRIAKLVGHLSGNFSEVRKACLPGFCVSQPLTTAIAAPVRLLTEVVAVSGIVVFIGTRFRRAHAGRIGVKCDAPRRLFVSARIGVAFYGPPSMSSTESKIPVGTLLVGKYRVAREIGRGGMAAVYEAEQLSLGKKVAVKILASELAASTIVIERFFREARAAASVSSPYIVDVYDSGRLDDGRPFITMELLEGESLYDRMARVRIIDVDTTIRVIVHTARGLVKAHGAGIVHRDLKPENIFLTKGEDGDDVCKILDFGLAKFYAPVNPEEKAAKRLTREGAVFGTPAYMSPEQVKGQGNVDHRADLWALGCMAYECLIGRPVWNMDQGVAMTFASIATGPIPVPSAARADLPPALDAWFKKCLERDPAHRYQSARELADAFVESWGQRPVSSASFLNVNMSSGSGKFPPRVLPPVGDEHMPGATVGVSAELASPAMSQRNQAGDVAALSPSNTGPGSLTSDPSLSLPLLRRSAIEGAPLEVRDAPSERQAARTPVFRIAVSAVTLGGSVSAALFVWLRFLNPQVFTPVVQSTATVVPSATTSGVAGTSGPVIDEPKWSAVITEAQRRFTGGDAPGALQKLQEATALGPQAAAIAKVYADQFRFIAKEATGPCKPVAFSRPRLATEKKGERPAIRATPKGSLITWTDDHEQKDHDHVYGVMLGDTGKSLGPVRDLTPEAADAQRPQLIAQSPDSERTVLLYWDRSGREQGVRVRFLDAEGRIDQMKGQSRLVGAARPGDYWPAIEKSPTGYFVVWQDDRDKEKEYDLFVRALSNDLDTVGPETRLTDYYAAPKSRFPAPRVRYPSVAVAANTLLVAYRLEKDKERERLIVRMRVPLADLEKNGLEESKEVNRESREFGDAKPVNEDKAPADAPAIACGSEGCFVVWHGEAGGAYAAAIDPNAGRVQWRKKFSDKGGRPSIAVHNGQVAIAYYESGRLKMAFLSRDGVTAPSTLLRVFEGTASGVPRPSLAAGARPSEWAIAWQDSDAPKGSPEVYATRIQCK